MSGGTQTIDRQLGEWAAEMRAFRADMERHAETTESMRITLVQIQVQLGKIDGERKASLWVNRLVMGLVSAVLGAVAGHMTVPPGAH